MEILESIDWLLFAILTFAYFTQTITGFGSNVISLTFGGLFFVFSDILPIVISQNLILCIYLIGAYISKLDRKLLLHLLFPALTLSFIVGMILEPKVKGAGFITIVFAVMVMFISAYGLYLDKKPQSQIKGSDRPNTFWLYLCGLTHGMFAAGGPFIVYYAARLNVDKLVFRTQLSVIWLTLNSILLIKLAFDGHVTTSVLQQALLLSPTLIIGIFAGELLQKKLSAKLFLKIVYVFLFFSGVAMVVKWAQKMFAS